MFKEEWKPVPGYDKLYWVSDQGRVRSLKHGKVRILKTSRTRDGYLQVGLCKNGKNKTFRVHRLVWFVFVGPIPEGYEINHINECRTDNRLVNINLMTRTENNNWGGHNERMRASLSRTVLQYSQEGELLYVYESLKQAAEATGYSKGYLSDTCNGKFSSCHGFVWKYA